MSNDPKLYGVLVRWNNGVYRVTGFNALKEEYSLSNVEIGKSVFVSFKDLEEGADIVEDEVQR